MTLFWIAVSNFVFPVLLSLAQLIFTFRDSSYLDGGYIFLTNNYVEIIGVLLATVWAAGSHWSSNGQASRSGMDTTETLSIPQFYDPSSSSRAPGITSTFMSGLSRNSGSGANAPATSDSEVALETFRVQTKQGHNEGRSGLRRSGPLHIEKGNF